jgi:hypothetical protein
MATPPTPRQVTRAVTYVPPTRTGWVITGIVVIVFGVVLGGFAAQTKFAFPGFVFSNPLSSGSSSTAPTATPTPSLNPTGDAPKDFIIYRDPQTRYALYYSKTWTSQQSSIPVSGQNVDGVAFTPAGSKLPQWWIGAVTTRLTVDNARTILNATLTAQGASDFTPTNGPAPITIGTSSWVRLDGTVTTGDQSTTVSFSIHDFGTGSILVMATSIPINFDTTNQQDFTPMINSLNIKE